MPHRYKVREIAQQSGLSEATVDRLPNWPPGMRENTRAEVMQATVDRAGTSSVAQLGLAGRPLPHRRCHADTAAVLRRLPGPGRGRTACIRACHGARAFICGNSTPQMVQE